MPNKIYCKGSGSIPTEVRRYPSRVLKDTLGQCGVCERILKVTTEGRLRKHSVRGKNTASHDRTLEILWDGAKPEEQQDQHNPEGGDMSDQYEGIFNNATMDDFIRDTSARLELANTGQGQEAFSKFVDEQLRAVRMAWIAAETYMQPLTVIANGKSERVFIPDDDETMGQFIERMHREALSMEASWAFVAKRTMVANLGSALDVDVDVDVTDPQEWEKAVAAGIVRLGVVWYAERREGDERHYRHGQMQDEEGTLGQMSEGSQAQEIPLFASILDR